MAASVRIENEAFSDVRYDVLATLCLLADADHARGKMAVLWRQCTTLGTYVLPASMVSAVLGENGASALVESRLGDVVDGGIRVRGTRGRIEWLKKLRKNAQKGGKAKAAKRQNGGTVKAAKSLPIPFPPSPSPSPSEISENTNAREGTRTEPPPIDLGMRRRAERRLLEQRHAERYHAVVAALGSEARPLNLAGDGERWLSECLLARGADLDAAVADCRRALENREKQALRLKTVRFFGPRMWSSDEFTDALGWTDADIAKMGAKAIATAATKAPEPRRLT